MSGSVSSEEGELNAIIKEFLEYSKLSSTLHSFEEECQKLGKPIQDQAGKSRKDERILKIKNELLQRFDRGERTEFFSEWDTHINPEVRENNLFFQKLEFSLQVHFAILPMRKIDHWSKEEVEEAMLHFHYYLESKGSLLSDCAEFLPFYALPYVPRPNTHPSFSEIFEDSWVPKLRTKLEGFLFEGLKGSDDEIQEPRLIELYHNRDLDLQDARKELQYLERHIEESEKRTVLHAKKCEKLQEECRQLMAVSSLLVTALENAVKGNLVDMDCVLSACTTHLPSLEKLRSESPSFMSSIKESHISSNILQKKLKNGKEKLDFDKLKQDLKNSNDRKRSLLFQALRWRLTKVGGWQTREETVLEFVNNDLLDLNSNEGQETILLFIRSTNEFLLESFTRFINAFASFVLGRQYLTSNTTLIERLVEHLLSSEPKDNMVLDMLMGTLKKLSIRKTSQAYMVECGVIEWLTKAVHAKDIISDYALYSSVALLFNLSLCPMGKKRCEPLRVELISGLGKLLQMQDSKISPYVNGILYRILSIPSVRDYAKEQALPSALRKVMSKSEGEPKKQLETILELFVTDVQIEDGSSDEEDDDQENDSLEPEIDANDLVKSEDTEADGENLLESYYQDKEIEQPEDINMNDSKEIAHLTLSHASEIRSAASEISLKPNSIVGSTTNSELPVTPKMDVEATQLVRKIVGTGSTTLVEAAAVPDPASVTIKGLNANEYTVAFSSRPKIPRTPEPGETASPNISSSSPLRSSYQREFHQAVSSQGIYCNN